MKTSLRQKLSFLLLLLAAGLQAKVVQPGRVRLQNSGNKPLAGVQVSFFGSNRTTSDGKGIFLLEFPDKKPGDEIVAPKVSRPGYEWVNEPSFRAVAASPQVSLELVMCPAGQLEANRQKYYEIAETATLAALEKRLKAAKARMRNDEARWQREKDSLNAQLERQLLRAREMADEFSRMNFDDASELHRRAFALFQQGDIDSAIHVLEDAHLTQQAGIRIRRRDTLAARLQANDRGIRGILAAMLLRSRLQASGADTLRGISWLGSDSAFGLDTAVARVALDSSVQERWDAAFRSDTSDAGTRIVGLGLQAWLNLFSRRFHLSDSCSRAALAAAGTRPGRAPAHWIEANLAHALLFQGRFPEAVAIYRDLKERPYSFDTTKTFARVLLEDFDVLEKAGIVHPDVAKVRALLGTKAAAKPEPVPAAAKGKP